MNDKFLKKISYISSIISILGILGILVFLSMSRINSFDLTWAEFVPSIILFPLWVVLPYLILFLITYRAVSHRIISTAVLLSVLGGFLSMYMYIDGLFIHSSSTSPLGFIFVPIYQIFGILIGFGISKIISWLD